MRGDCRLSSRLQDVQAHSHPPTAGHTLPFRYLVYSPAGPPLGRYLHVWGARCTDFALCPTACGGSRDQRIRIARASLLPRRYTTTIRATLSCRSLPARRWTSWSRTRCSRRRQTNITVVVQLGCNHVVCVVVVSETHIRILPWLESFCYCSGIVLCVDIVTEDRNKLQTCDVLQRHRWRRMEQIGAGSLGLHVTFAFAGSFGADCVCKCTCDSSDRRFHSTIARHRRRPP